jgi:hypothetical protein
MSTAARKARKREGRQYSKRPKRLTRVYGQAKGLGFVTMAEIVAGMVIRDQR